VASPSVEASFKLVLCSASWYRGPLWPRLDAGLFQKWGDSSRVFREMAQTTQPRRVLRQLVVFSLFPSALPWALHMPGQQLRARRHSCLVLYSARFVVA